MGRAARSRQTQQRSQPATVLSPDLYGNALGALQAGNEAAAIVLLRQVLAGDETHRPARYNLAAALMATASLAEAIAEFRILVARNPSRLDALVGLAEALRRHGAIAEAADVASSALELAGEHSAPRLVRGAARFDLGDLDGSLADLRIGVALEGRPCAGHKLLGRALAKAGLRREAVESLRVAALACPTDGEIHRLEGDLLDQLGHLAEGFAAYRRAIELDPSDLYAYTNLSGLLCKTKLLDVALSVIEVALKLAPDLSQLHYNRAMAFEKLDRSAEALAAYQEALRCDPSSVQALYSAGRLKSHLCDWDGLDVLQASAMTCSPATGTAAAPFSVVVSSSSPADILACNLAWSATVDAGAAPLTCYAPRGTERARERLRLGYLSADFHNHATAQLVAELFEHHDRTRFETFGYSIGADDESAMRRRLVAGLEHFHDVATLGFDEAAALIASHEIDILVDLKGYTYQAKPEILARRPAPIQVNFLGYPSTMGAPFVDYVVGDRFVTPFDHAPFYSEKIAQLPHSYQPNDRRRNVAPMPDRASEGLPDGAFVFCCLNAAYKITPRLFDVWAHVLRRVEGSVLWLYARDETVRANLRREATRRGLDAARIVFADKRPPAIHLARMALADLFLDTTPCGAHTTGSEALWAGLPMLTLLGQTFASRVGVSLVTACGLPELAMGSLDDYSAMAIALAKAPERLAELRRRLVDGRATAPLFDSERFARDLETAFARMAAMRDAGEEPKAFSV